MDILSIKSNDLNISIRREGNPNGQDVLFIHGMFQSNLCWEKQFNSELTQKYNLFALDLRGHGMSDKPSKKINYTKTRKWADDIAYVIKELGLNKPILVGWSYGGYVVCDYLSIYGEENILGIAFIGAALKLDKDFDMIGTGLLDNMKGIVSSDILESIDSTINFLESCTYQKDELFLRKAIAYNMLVPNNIKSALMLRRLNYESILSNISVPVQFIYGKYDNIILPEMALYGHSMVKDSKICMFENSGHIPFVEESKKFNKLLDEFLENL